jgi:ABC-2 type transport system permease protein
MNKSTWIGYKTIVRKEFRRFIKIWVQTLLPPAITTALYFLIFGEFLGEHIKFGNFEYSQFIAPGLIMMVIVNNSFANTVSSFFQSKMMKSLEELLVSPLSNIAIISGFATGGLLRGLISGVIVSCVSLLFTPITIHSFFIITIFTIVTSLFFALLGLLNGIFAKNFDDVNIIPTFVLTPMVYLGGVFYSIEMLPSIWQNISLFNPLLYIIDGFRYGFLGISSINVWLSLFILILSTIILFIINYYFLSFGDKLRG